MRAGLLPARGIAVRRESPTPSHPDPAAQTPQDPGLLPHRRGTLGFAPAAIPGRRLRARPRNGAPLLGLPLPRARALSAGASPSNVRGGAGKRRGEEVAGLGGGAARAGTREASQPGLGLGRVESPLLFFPWMMAKP